MIHPGHCSMRGNDPWEITMRSFTSKGLRYQQEILIHEFMHLFHSSHYGYRIEPQQNRLLNEAATDRATKTLLKRNPGIADEITKELITHPNCSIVFRSDEERDTPFWNYYRGLVANLAKEVRDETSVHEGTHQLKILRLANEVGL
jgi:hypothetical protein